MVDFVNMPQHKRVRKERPTLVMKLLEMMDFVLILVIAMMSRSSLTFQTKN